MKALVIKCVVYDSILDMTHGRGRGVKRIVVGNLAITPDGDHVYATPDYVITNEQTIGEVEIPDDLVEAARTFARAKAEFYSLKPRFEELLS